MTGATSPVPVGLPTSRPRDDAREDFVEVLRSLGEFTQFYARSAPKRAFEAHLSELASGLTEWVLPAWCRVCRQGSPMLVDLEFSDGVTPNFLERLVCPTCSMAVRQRFLAEQVRSLATTGAARVVAIEGNAGTFADWAAAEAAASPGLQVLREAESGNPCTAIVSIDRLPGVRDLDQALQDRAERLAPGGRLVMSVPFHAGARTTVSLPPQAPASGLPRHQLGWDVLDRCVAAGFDDAYVLVHWSAAFGYLGNGAPLVLVAERA